MSGAGRGRPSMRLGVGIGFAILAISAAAPVIRMTAPISPEVVACLRVVVTVGVFGIVARRPTVIALRTLKGAPRAAAWTILAGLCLAAHFAAWITSLGLTSIVRAVALVSTQPGVRRQPRRVARADRRGRDRLGAAR